MQSQMNQLTLNGKEFTLCSPMYPGTSHARPSAILCEVFHAGTLSFRGSNSDILAQNFTLGKGFAKPFQSVATVNSDLLTFF
jgi:hypothetical protein